MELNIVTTCFMAAVLYVVHWIGVRRGKNKGIMAGIAAVTSCFIRVYYKDKEGNDGFVDLITGPHPHQHHNTAKIIMEQFSTVHEIIICNATGKDKVSVVRRWDKNQGVFLPYFSQVNVPDGFNGFWSSEDAPY